MSSQQYSEETLQEAVRLVQEEGWSYGEAQKATGVPKTTIYNYNKSAVISKKRKGRDTVLTREEELCLVEWCTNLAKVGFPVTDDDLLDQVQKRLNKDKRKTTFVNTFQLLMQLPSSRHALKFHPFL